MRRQAANEQPGLEREAELVTAVRRIFRLRDR
jgi:hypothetical protein